MQKTDELRLLQLISLKCLKDTAAACKELNVNYFLVAGTLLGAIRHKGFIPWDSDIDIGMLRVDYDRFLKCAPGLLGDKYFIQHDKSDKRNKTFFTKIRIKGTKFVEKNNMSTGDSNGIYIDLFPIDDIKLKPGKFKSYLFKIMTIIIRLKAFKCGKKHSSSLTNSIVSFFIFAIFFWVPLKFINFAIEKYIRKDNEKGYLLATNYNSKYGIYRQTMDKSIYHDLGILDFEGLSFSVPKNHEYWLTKIYGDYMGMPKKIPERSDVLVPYHINFGGYSYLLGQSEIKIRALLGL